MIGEKSCPRCHGWVVDSPEDLADRCYNCGRLYYRFVPSRQKPERESKVVVRREFSPLPNHIWDIITESGGTIHIANLYEKMLSEHGTVDRRVRYLLERDPRFSALGRGLWTITVKE